MQYGVNPFDLIDKSGLFKIKEKPVLLKYLI